MRLREAVAGSSSRHGAGWRGCVARAGGCGSWGDSVDASRRATVAKRMVAWLYDDRLPDPEREADEDGRRDSLEDIFFRLTEDVVAEEVTATAS